MNEKINTLWIKVKTFFKVYKIDAVAAIVVWYAPSWLAFFIPALEPTALWWLGLLTSPLIPVVVVVPVTAVFFHWLRKKIWQLVLYVKDQLDKVQMQNQMSVYYTRNEMRLILDKGKEMYKIKTQDKDKYNKKQDDKRHKLITENWETSLEESQ